MNDRWNNIVPEHEDMCVAFFTDDIIFKPISNTLVGNSKLVFVVLLEPNCMFIYGYAMCSITSII